MHIFHSESINEIYKQLIIRCANKGELEAKTRELTGVHICLEDPTQSLIYLKKNWKWCFQELFDRMSGIFNMPEEYANPGRAYHFRPTWKRKLEKEGGKFHYSYGECYRKQVPAIIQQLKKQKTSREAIINMWHEDYLITQPAYNRRPCTLTIHFLIRDKKLQCYVNMRTNDLVNLLPYDIFHHTFLQRYIAQILGVGLGSYHHFASHMYYPKKRESPGRNWVENVLFKLENVCATRYEIIPTRLKSYTLEDDFINAYNIIDGDDLDCHPAPAINSELIKNLVNFILNRDLNPEYNYLSTRK
jgi:thymidylate synthase